MLLRPTGVDVTKSNTAEHVYIKGDAITEGSLRLRQHVEEGEDAHMEKLEGGFWIPTSLGLGAQTLWLGHDVGLGAVGHSLIVKSATSGHAHFLAHSLYLNGLTAGDTKVVNVHTRLTRQVIESDESGEWTGNCFDYVAVAPFDLMTNSTYVKTGATAATDDIHYIIYHGTDATGEIIFDQWFHGEDFPINSEVRLVFRAPAEFNAGESYFTRIQSEGEDFSLKTDAAETVRWLATDMMLFTEDNLLQTAPWTDGASWTAGDLFIDDRKIYKSNATGIQTGTFADNSDNWDELISNSEAGTYWQQSAGVLSNKAGATSMVFNDGTRDRIVADSGDTSLYTPDGGKYLQINNNSLRWIESSVHRLIIHNTYTALKSADGSARLNMDANEILLVQDDNNRLRVDSNYTSILSPSGNNLNVGNAGLAYNGATVQTSAHKGVADGIAELNSSGIVPESQLPAYVDEVVEGYLDVDDTKGNGYDAFYEEAGLTTKITEATGKIYVDLNTSSAYRWTTTVFTMIGTGLVLGESDANAYRGDRGKIAYDHSQVSHYSHPTGNGNLHVPANIQADDNLKSLVAGVDAGVYTWEYPSKIRSADGLTYATVWDAGLALSMNGNRFEADSSSTKLLSPFGAQELLLTAGGIYYNEVELATVDDLHSEYTHPTGDGGLHVPANSTTNDGKVLTAGATAGVYTWEDASGHDPDRIVSPDGLNYMIVGNDYLDYYHHDGASSKSRIEISDTIFKAKANDGSSIQLADDLLKIYGTGGTQQRIGFDSTRTKLYSPNGTSNLEVNNNGTEIVGYTKLGADVATPRIQVKKLTGTLGALGVHLDLAHGVAPSKILAVNVFINYSADNHVAPHYGGGYDYKYILYNNNVRVAPAAGATSLVGKNVRVLITYEA